MRWDIQVNGIVLERESIWFQIQITRKQINKTQKKTLYSSVIFITSRGRIIRGSFFLTSISSAIIITQNTRTKTYMCVYIYALSYNLPQTCSNYKFEEYWNYIFVSFFCVNTRLFLVLMHFFLLCIKQDKMFTGMNEQLIKYYTMQLSSLH